MDDVAGKVQLFHSLFLGLLVMAVVCFILAVVIFFMADIKGVIGYLTGRTAKKRIQALKESSEASGRLMSRERTNVKSLAREVKEDMGIRDTVSPGIRKVENVIQNASELSSETVHEFTGSFTDGSAYTPSGQSVQPDFDGTTAILDGVNVPIGTFSIEKEIILIHAEEVI